MSINFNSLQTQIKTSGIILISFLIFILFIFYFFQSRLLSFDQMDNRYHQSVSSFSFYIEQQHELQGTFHNNGINQFFNTFNGLDSYIIRTPESLTFNESRSVHWPVDFFSLFISFNEDITTPKIVYQNSDYLIYLKTLRVNNIDTQIYILAENNPLTVPILNYISYIIIFSLAFTFIFLVYNKFLYHRFVNPIVLISKVMKSAQHGFFTPLNTNAGSKELTDVAVSFNNMFSKLKEREEQLKKSRDMALLNETEKTNFVSNLSRDINKPLQKIQTYLENIDVDKFNSQDKKNLLNTIHKVFSISDFSLEYLKYENNEKKLNLDEYNLYDMIYSVLDKYRLKALEKNITLQAVYPSNLPVYFNFDYKKLFDVIEKLINNAIHYTPDEGIISVHVYLLHRMDNNAEIKINISDSGSGITEDDFNIIFEPYYQKNKNKTGSGLGLSIVKKIINLMNGTIDVYNNNGAVFSIRLELQISKGKENFLYNSQFEEFQDYQALIFSDNPIISEFVVDILSHLPYVFTSSYKEFMSEVTNNIDQYDLILIHTEEILDFAYITPYLSDIVFINLNNEPLYADHEILNYAFPINKIEFDEHVISKISNNKLEKEKELNGYYNYSSFVNFKPYDKSDLSILIVENNHIQQNFIKNILFSLDYNNYMIAEHGQEVNDIYDNGAVFDVVFISTNIPQISFCKILDNITKYSKSNNLEIPFFVAVSEKYIEEEINYCKNNGFDCIIKRPYRKDKINWILS